MLEGYEPAHIVGVSQEPHTCRQHHAAFNRGVTRSTPTRATPRGSDSQSPCRRRARRRRGDRRGSRLQVAGVVVLDGALALAGRICQSTARPPSSVMRSARPGVPFPTAPRSSTTRFRVSPISIQPSFAPCAGPRPMPQPTASSSSSTAAGAPTPTRTNFAARRSPSTARKRRPPDGWPPAPRLSMCRGTRSTSGPPMPRRGCPQHGAAYGLCQIYGNEPWHYELRPAAGDHGCPALYADPTHDPRMQR